MGRRAEENRKSRRIGMCSSVVSNHFTPVRRPKTLVSSLNPLQALKLLESNPLFFVYGNTEETTRMERERREGEIAHTNELNVLTLSADCGISDLHTYIHTRVPSPTYTPTHAYINKHACMHACMHTYARNHCKGIKEVG